uniref:Reverse transcriptase zinc-binding domain-containing protein n=1 Tax=Aegilops tauschii subsp. strangulata TaxID=200361 RepID=A0A453NGM3_AEGTS
MQHHPCCLLCDQAPETMRHLLMDCTFARQTWHEVLTWLGVQIPTPNNEATLMDWWLRSTQAATTLQCKALASVTETSSLDDLEAQ